MHFSSFGVSGFARVVPTEVGVVSQVLDHAAILFRLAPKGNRIFFELFCSRAARLDDGLLDLAVLSDASRADLMRLRNGATAEIRTPRLRFTKPKVHSVLSRG